MINAGCGGTAEGIMINAGGGGAPAFGGGGDRFGGGGSQQVFGCGGGGTAELE